MKRIRVWLMVVVGVVSVGGLSERARGQPEIEALIWYNGGGTARSALIALNYTYERAVGETRFIAAMQRKSWDLVVLDLPYAFIFQPEVTLQLLEDHVAGGGRLLVNFNNLDGWPELQRLMGVENAISFDIPKLTVDHAIPIHPSWGQLFLARTGDPYGDSGDELVPSPGGSEVAAIFPNGMPAVVISNGGRTIVNGFDWDTYSSPSIFPQFQMKYLMACRADFDTSTRSKVLDIFDFLAFQNLFVQQHWNADLRFDGVFDIFDFLDFQSFFAAGCD